MRFHGCQEVRNHCLAKSCSCENWWAFEQSSSSFFPRAAHESCEAHAQCAEESQSPRGLLGAQTLQCQCQTLFLNVVFFDFSQVTFVWIFQCQGQQYQSEGEEESSEVRFVQREENLSFMEHNTFKP